jgi:hypothetical protein
MDSMTRSLAWRTWRRASRSLTNFSGTASILSACEIEVILLLPPIIAG